MHRNITRKLPVLRKLKCHVVHFLFSVFSPTKLENRRAEKVLAREERRHH
jgi:hypothetical protein